MISFDAAWLHPGLVLNDGHSVGAASFARYHSGRRNRALSIRAIALRHFGTPAAIAGPGDIFGFPLVLPENQHKRKFSTSTRLSFFILGHDDHWSEGPKGDKPAEPSRSKLPHIGLHSLRCPLGHEPIFP